MMSLVPGPQRHAAIVTGGGSGIGRALATALGRRGLYVVVADVDGAAARSTAELVAGHGGRAEARVLDVTVPGALAGLVDDVAARHGLAYHFNNAGVGGALPFERATPEQWDRIIALNLRSVVDGTAAAYRVMVRQGYGHIVNTASVAGLVPVPGQALYNTTKFAVVGLSSSLRTEAAPRGVRVSSVCPGNVATEIFAKPILGPPASRASIPADAISPEAAAAQILRGVDRNRELIVLPAPARLLVAAHRWLPPVWRRWARDEQRRRSGMLQG